MLTFKRTAPKAGPIMKEKFNTPSRRANQVFRQETSVKSATTLNINILSNPNKNHTLGLK